VGIVRTQESLDSLLVLRGHKEAEGRTKKGLGGGGGEGS
jgi:hypothetical protein